MPNAHRAVEFAGVPLALAVVQQAAAREARAQTPRQLVCDLALGRAQRGRVPFRGGAVAQGHEGRLAARAEAHVAGREPVLHGGACRQDRLPLRVAVGPGDTRGLVEALNAHGYREIHLGRAMRAGDRRRTRGGRRGRQWNVALGGEQAGGRVEADPASAGDIDLRPGVQVREVLAHAPRDIPSAGCRRRVRPQLDEVARDEARREAEAAQDLHQQPAGVAAGARPARQRLLGRLHARLHARAIADILAEGAVEAGDEIDRPGRPRGRDLLDVAVQRRCAGRQCQVGAKIVGQRRLVPERPARRALVHEEVERIDGGHVGHQVHGDGERLRLFGHDNAGEEVSERVLHPVEQMQRRRDAHRIGEDGGAAVRGRPQPHQVRSKLDAAVIPVLGPMRQGDVEVHGMGAGAALRARVRLCLRASATRSGSAEPVMPVYS